jgi:hypothetical protein
MAFHQFCLNPVIATHDIPEGDDDFLCHKCGMHILIDTGFCAQHLLTFHDNRLLGGLFDIHK